jgi:methylated-DNA-[protein]-cysteine S-methyltransferase
METIYEASISSRLGRITLRTSDQGIREVALGDRIAPRQRESDYVKLNGQKTSGARWARQAARELEEYAAGKRKEFSVPLDVDGTAFQKKVWRALLTIPYGETRSYGAIARQVGNPRGARAVGMANHHNPVAIVVPCHRVIASDGSLGGYAGGLQKKSQILQLEKSHS